MGNRLLVILGATASGKTKLAVQVAVQNHAEIISADSRQVFRNMDIGTGKDLNEYKLDDISIPYHLINILDAGAKYNVNAFKNDFFSCFKDITHRSKLPILCGGTGLYIQSVLQNMPYTAVPINLELRDKLEILDKQELIFKLNKYPNKLIEHVDLDSKKRLIRALEIVEYLKDNILEKIEQPKLNPLVIGLKNEVNFTRNNIINRLQARLKEGMIEEVEQLINSGLSYDILSFYGLEYKFISMYLKGEINYINLEERLGIAICQYAKRQNTYFRKMEKDGIEINWLNAQKSISELTDEVNYLIKSKTNKY